MKPLAVTTALLLAFGAAPAQAQIRQLADTDVLPATRILPPAEEARFAATGAPDAISANATILVYGESGLTPFRNGTNGYTCLVERFEQASVLWPTCYDAESSRLFVVQNQLLEEHRAARKTAGEYRTELARAYRTGRIAPPRRSGVSYRLSREMATVGSDGNAQVRPLWMILVSMPYVTYADLGYDVKAQSAVFDGITPSFGLQSAGGPGAYLWVRMERAPETAASGSQP